MTSRQGGLRSSDAPLGTTYDVAMLDLDGVVYIGSRAVPGAPQHLLAAREAGMRLAYITNNASRPPSAVAQHLSELGIPVAHTDVVTAAQAAARLLAERLPGGSNVFVIGGTGLFAALAEHDLHGVQDIADDPVAVVSGYHPDLRWHTVIEGAILVQRGLPWVASNADRTVPTRYGPGPGNGVLVGAVADFAGRQPVVAGKPEPSLFEETLIRVGGTRPLVVGDRLDTDIEGAVRSGYDSLLVMTGVTGVAQLVEAGPAERPSYIAADLGGLAEAHDQPVLEDGAARAGGWCAATSGGTLVVDGDGSLDDWWRAVAAAAWAYADSHGRPVDAGSVQPPGSVR
jgi:glycerol-1-phosphatase